MPFGLSTPTYVLDVWALRKESLSKGFIDYDTKIESEKSELGKPKPETHYKLPYAKVYLVIILWTNGDIWTTIRTATEEKKKYYKSLIGQEVKIEIKK